MENKRPTNFIRKVILIGIAFFLPMKTFAQVSEEVLKKSLCIYLDKAERNNGIDTLKIYFESTNINTKNTFRLKGVYVKVFEDYGEIGSGEFLSISFKKESSKRLEVILVQRSIKPKTSVEISKIISGSAFVAVFKLFGKKWKYISYYEIRQ